MNLKKIMTDKLNCKNFHNQMPSKLNVGINRSLLNEEFVIEKLIIT